MRNRFVTAVEPVRLMLADVHVRALCNADVPVRALLTLEGCSPLQPREMNIVPSERRRRGTGALVRHGALISAGESPALLNRERTRSTE